MPRHLPRFHAHHQKAEDARKLARILLETGEPAPPPTTKGSSNGGDWERLGGLPAIGRGVSGAVHGSDPLRSLLAKARERRR